MALRHLGRLDDAIAAGRRGIEIAPTNAATYHNLARCLGEVGRIEQTIKCYRKAIALDDSRGVSRSGLLLALHSRAVDAEPQSLFEQHLEWSRAVVEPLRRFHHPHENQRDPDRKLRIGYVSPNFARHSVAYFLDAILANHHRERFEIICYSDVSRPDEVTDRFRRLAERWDDWVGLSDESAAERVRNDRIDILIDLAGHTADNRLRVFAQQPAPVQVTYLGYPDTSGLTTIQWRLTDDVADPAPASDAFYTERLWRLPGPFLCYAPPAESPPVGPPARQAGRPVTFACFNTFRKIDFPVMELWAKILRELPEARLMLKAHGLSSVELRREVTEAFARSGVEPGRLDLLQPVSTVAEHLACYQRADIALDTFPYNGTTTTCEALWMGVPVVNRRGRIHASRVGASLLTAVALEELLADDEASYVRIATELARDVDRLETLRGQMRERMMRSPLLDAPRFTRNLEDAYRSMWRQWCVNPQTL